MCPRRSQESALPLGNVPAAGWRCQRRCCVGQGRLREAVGWREVSVRFPPRPLQGRWGAGGGPGGNRRGGGWVGRILIVGGNAVRSGEKIHRQSGSRVLPSKTTAPQRQGRAGTEATAQREGGTAGRQTRILRVDGT